MSGLKSALLFLGMQQLVIVLVCVLILLGIKMVDPDFDTGRHRESVRNLIIILYGLFNFFSSLWLVLGKIDRYKLYYCDAKIAQSFLKGESQSLPARDLVSRLLIQPGWRSAATISLLYTILLCAVGLWGLPSDGRLQDMVQPALKVIAVQLVAVTVPFCVLFLSISLLGRRARFIDSVTLDAARTLLKEEQLRLLPTLDKPAKDAIVVREAGQELFLDKHKLAGADLSGLNLDNANLAKVDLTNTNFARTSLKEADLENSNLDRTLFHDADLSSARMETSRDLGTRHLSGADISYTTLPSAIDIDEAAPELETITQSASGTFQMMLIGCAIAWITIATTKDFSLLSNAEQTTLPVIEIELPLIAYYLVAPMVLLMLFVYFQLYLQKYWEKLATLPAVFPDGSTLDQKIPPWLLSSLIEVRFSHLQETGGVSLPTKLNILAASLCAWGIVPVTILAYWLRFLPAQNLVGTLTQCLFFAISTVIALVSYQLANATLGRGITTDLDRDRYVARKMKYDAGIGIASLVATAGLSIYLLLYAGVPVQLLYPNLSDAEVSKKPESWANKDEDLAAVKGAQLRGRSMHAGNLEGAFLVNANLQDVTLSDADMEDADLRHAICYKADFARADMTAVKMRCADIRAANFYGAYLMLADLSESQYGRVRGRKVRDWGDSSPLATSTGLRRVIVEAMKGGQLDDIPKRLTETDDTFSLPMAVTMAGTRSRSAQDDTGDMWEDSVNFTRADLTDTNFQKAKLPCATFFRAAVDGTDFSEANLEGALFNQAIGTADGFGQMSCFASRSNPSELEQAFKTAGSKPVKFVKANLNSADFTQALLPKADAGDATIDGANFSGAYLPNSQFTHADSITTKDATFENTDLRGATLSGRFINCKFRKADLKGAKLANARFVNCDFREADLRNTQAPDTSFENCSLAGAIR